MSALRNMKDDRGCPLKKILVERKSETCVDRGLEREESRLENNGRTSTPGRLLIFQSPSFGCGSLLVDSDRVCLIDVAEVMDGADARVVRLLLFLSPEAASHNEGDQSQHDYSASYAAANGRCRDGFSGGGWAVSSSRCSGRPSRAGAGGCCGSNGSRMDRRGDGSRTNGRGGGSACGDYGAGRGGSWHNRGGSRRAREVGGSLGNIGIIR